MPPIDPRLIPQQSQGQTLADAPPAMDPYYSPPPPPPARRTWSLPPTVRMAEHRQDALLPTQVDKAGTDAQIAKLHLREMRLKQGLDPDTGKAPTIDTSLVGNDALKNLAPGEQEIVKGITQGRVPVSSLALARNPNLYRLTQIAFQYDPGTDLTTFQRRQAAFQKFMSNPNSPMVRVNQALQHLERFAKNAEGLDNFHSSVLTNPLNLGNYARTAYKASSKDPAYEAFASDRDALATELAAAFQGSGQSALADREEWQKRLSAANSPESFHKIMQETVALLGGRVEASNAQFKQAVGANADFYDLMSPKARKVYEKYTGETVPELPDADVEKHLSTTQKTIPVPDGYEAAHQAFLKAHPPGTLTSENYQELRQQLDKQFLEGQTSHLDPEDVKHFVELYNKGAEPTKLPAINVPLSKLESIHAGIAESAPGVLLGDMGNAGSLGLVDLAVGQQGREARDLADKSHSAMALTGEIAGSIGGMTALEKLGLKGFKIVGGKAVRVGTEDATKRVLLRDAEATARQKLAGDIGLNATYGGARGFNGADDGEGLEGAAKGVAMGTVASIGGNVVTKGVAPIFSERTIQALDKLKGVKLTTLQKLGLGKAEAAATTVPLAHGARAKAMGSFNTDNANRALSYIGQKVPKGIEPGTEMNAYVDKTLSNAYNEIRPKIVGSADGQFDNAIVALKGLANTPEKKRMFTEIQDAVDMFKDKVTGHYTGQGYKEASTRLRALTDAFSTAGENQGSIAAMDMARVAEQARKNIQTLVQRQTPEVGARLKSIERGWAHKMRIEDATNRAMSADNTGIYSPNQLLAASKKLDTSANKGMTARGKGFDQEYGQAAAKVMGGGSVPKVSLLHTTGALGLMGLGTFKAAPAMPFIAGAAIGAYGPGIKRIVQLALTGKRPRAVDNAIVRRALEDYLRHSATGD